MDLTLLLTFGAEGTLKIWNVLENNTTAPELLCVASIAQLNVDNTTNTPNTTNHHQSNHTSNHSCLG